MLPPRYHRALPRRPGAPRYWRGKRPLARSFPCARGGALGADVIGDARSGYLIAPSSPGSTGQGAAGPPPCKRWPEIAVSTTTSDAAWQAAREAGWGDTELAELFAHVA